MDRFPTLFLLPAALLLAAAGCTTIEVSVFPECTATYRCPDGLRCVDGLCVAADGDGENPDGDADRDGEGEAEAEADPDIRDRSLGEPCGNDGQCRSGFCLDEERAAVYTGFEIDLAGNYCTEQCGSSAMCGEGGQCFDPAPFVSGTSDLCWKRCDGDEDCRYPQYSCASLADIAFIHPQAIVPESPVCLPSDLAHEIHRQLVCGGGVCAYRDGLYCNRAATACAAIVCTACTGDTDCPDGAFCRLFRYPGAFERRVCVRPCSGAADCPAGFSCDLRRHHCAPQAVCP